MTLSLASQIIAISLAVLQRQLFYNDAVSRSKWNDSYDYIVVGAGTAGCTVASRLSEDGRSSVLLLEAGGPGSVIADIPGDSAIMVDVRDNDWGYKTVPQANAGGIIADRRMNYPTGRIMGGSSSINLLVYSRGNRHDYDRWATEYSLTDWSYKKMLPYFMRAERLFNESVFWQTADYHGRDGPLAVSLPMFIPPIHKHIVEAWKRLGVAEVDINGPDQNGVTINQQTIDPRTWIRSSSVHAYIYPVINRTNLHIVANSHVTKVLISEGRAYGVEFVRDGQTHEVRANEDVIVSAGTIGTPRVLILSGIGPRDDLEELGVPLIADLPVGRNFQDHFMGLLPFIARNKSDLRWEEFQESRMTVRNLYDYFIHRTGPLTEYPVSQCYYSTPSNDNPEWPNTISANVVGQFDESILSLFQNRSNSLAWLEYFTPLVNNERLFMIGAGVYRIRTRGTVRLASRDPFEAPLIDPNNLANPVDEEAAVDSFGRVLEFADSPYFRQFANFYDRVVPGCENDLCPGMENRKCRPYLRCVAHTFGWTAWHGSCSARMGVNSEDSVVDSRLRVHNIPGLRVVDGSVLPSLINGNPNAAIFAVAEKASDLILEDRRAKF